MEPGTITVVLRLPKIVLAIVVVFFLIQLVPYRVKNHPVVSEPKWDSARTQQLFNNACADCHSNHTRSRVYEKVAPIAWWIANHVNEGRASLNVSECGHEGEDAHEAPEAVLEGSMPPSSYTWFGLHRDAQLTATERQQLADGLAATARLGCAN